MNTSGLSRWRLNLETVGGRLAMTARLLDFCLAVCLGDFADTMYFPVSMGG